MIKLPRDISAHDVHQWLNNGFFYVNVDGANRVAGYDGADEDVEKVGAELVESGDYVNVDFEDVYPHWPFCGALNVGPVGVFLNRRQERQYRRTYNSRQLQLAIPRRWEAMKQYGGAVREMTADTREVVLSAFAPQYPALSAVMDQLHTGEAFSRAINPHIVLVGAGDNVLVYYKNVYVAIMEPDGKLVPVNADRDTLRRLLKYFEGRATL